MNIKEANEIPFNTKVFLINSQDVIYERYVASKAATLDETCLLMGVGPKLGKGIADIWVRGREARSIDIFLTNLEAQQRIIDRKYDTEIAAYGKFQDLKLDRIKAEKKLEEMEEDTKQ